MIVKVCGIKEAENCLAIDELQPDLIGMIFYKKSPRFIGKTILPKTKAAKVGVFVNSSLEEIISSAQKHSLQYIQLHGNEPLLLAGKLHKKGMQIIKSFGIETGINNQEMAEWENYCSYFLFDTKSKLHGGTGIQFDWKLLESYQLKTPFLLSGGIGLNDAPALKKIKHPAFYGVDINSKFELEPGIKNIEQVKSFINEIRK